MPDHKELYLRLFRATEEAINVLVEAQQLCEELYLQAEEASVILLPEVKRDKSLEA